MGRTADSLARDLHTSLETKLLTLPDATLVYPAHGAGSACGKHLSSAASSTIGEQRATNYALAPMTDDQFVAAVTEGQSAAPLYFAFAADANRRDHALLDDHEPPAALDLDEALALAEEGAALIDTRSPESFASGHVRGSVNVGLDGRFAEYAGDVVRPGQRIVLLGDAGRGTEAKVRLARIGFDEVAGAVDGVERVLADRPDMAAPARRLPARDVADWLADDPEVQVVDVRNPGEVADSGTLARCPADPAPAAPRPPRRARSERADDRLLRGRLPLVDRGVGPACPRVRHRGRPHRRLRRLGGSRARAPRGRRRRFTRRRTLDRRACPSRR